MRIIQINFAFENETDLSLNIKTTKSTDTEKAIYVFIFGRIK